MTFSPIIKDKQNTKSSSLHAFAIGFLPHLGFVSCLPHLTSSSSNDHIFFLSLPCHPPAALLIIISISQIISQCLMFPPPLCCCSTSCFINPITTGYLQPQPPPPSAAWLPMARSYNLPLKSDDLMSRFLYFLFWNKCYECIPVECHFSGGKMKKSVLMVFIFLFNLIARNLITDLF